MTSLEQIIKNIKDYIEPKSEVTVFEVMAEKGYSFLDVSNTFELCIREGMLEKKDDVYIVVPKGARVTLKEKTERKLKGILEKLSDEEIAYLKEATDEKTLTKFERSCKKSLRFQRFAEHFTEIGLVKGEGGDYRLTLDEPEYLCFWKMVGEAPQKKETPSPKRKSFFDLAEEKIGDRLRTKEGQEELLSFLAEAIITLKREMEESRQAVLEKRLSDKKKSIPNVPPASLLSLRRENRSALGKIAAKVPRFK